MSENETQLRELSSYLLTKANSLIPFRWCHIYGGLVRHHWSGGRGGECYEWLRKRARSWDPILNTHGRHSVLCRDQVETTLPAVTTLQRFATRFVFKVPQHQQHLFTNWNQHTTNHPQPPLFLMNDHMSGSSIIHFSPYGDFGQFHVSDLTIIESRTSCYILSF